MRLLIGVGCFVVIVVPALLLGELLDARLLKADPDLIPTQPSLMQRGVSAGQQHFYAHCASCHGTGALGDSTRGIPDLTDSDWLYGQGSVGDIERVIYYGIRSANPNAWNLARMPAYATPLPSPANPKIPPLSPREITDVADYLLFLQGQTGDSAAISRGAAIYSNTGGCYDCHSPDARGDPAIGAPNLTDHTNLYGDGSQSALIDSIAHGRQGVCPAWVGLLSPVAMRDTALYVYSLSHAVLVPPVKNVLATTDAVNR